MGVPVLTAGLRGGGANSKNLIRVVPAEGFEMAMVPQSRIRLPAIPAEARS